MRDVIIFCALFVSSFGRIVPPNFPNKVRSKVPILDGRIVGGQPVQIEDIPYQVSLQYFGQHMCGASILGERFILTAAHCTDGTTPHALSIRAGSSNRDSGGSVHKVRTIHQDPRFSKSTIDYDMSILELETPIAFSASATAIGLPRRFEAYEEGTVGLVSGWGYSQEGGPLATQLQAVSVPLVDTWKCSQSYGFASITARMLCAGIPVGGKDACQGDSGGPLVYNGKQIGVVSWGYGCARPNYPGVYSNVSYLRSFITTITGQ